MRAMCRAAATRSARARDGAARPACEEPSAAMRCSGASPDELSRVLLASFEGPAVGHGWSEVYRRAGKHRTRGSAMSLLASESRGSWLRLPPSLNARYSTWKRLPHHPEVSQPGRLRTSAAHRTPKITCGPTALAQWSGGARRAGEGLRSGVRCCLGEGRNIANIAGPDEGGRAQARGNVSNVP